MKNINANLRLSDADWQKLREFNAKISKNIQQKLPDTWKLPLEDIQSAVYGTFIQLLSNYRPGAMSPTSYCWQYAEIITFKKLIHEYNRLYVQMNLDNEIGADKDDDEPCRHTYGKAKYLKELTVDDREARDNKLQVSDIIEKMPRIDRMIAEMIMEGYSYREIAKELGYENQMSVVKRMRKYR